MDSIIQGMNDYGSCDAKSETPINSARKLLAVRSFQSITSAVFLWERGYYQQAWALVRMAMEDQLVGKDMKDHPPTLAAILNEGGEIGKGNLRFAKMAERLPPQEKKVWDKHYGQASGLAAHPRPSSLNLLIKSDSEGKTSWGLSSHFDACMSKMILVFMLRRIITLWAQIGKLTFSAGSDWLIRTDPVYDQMLSLWAQMDGYPGEQVEETNGSAE